MNAERLPGFVIVGVPKAGTTSLYHYLKDHPQVFMPVKGELHYFTRDFIGAACEGPGDQATFRRVCRDWGEYRAFFAKARADQVVGEASPSYFFFPDCIPRLKEALGSDVRLILALRHPVDRAYSNYLHLRRGDREHLAFEEALAAEEERRRLGWGDFWRYREHSQYADRLETYLDAFPRAHLEVVIFEELIRDPRAVLSRLFGFLGVEPSYRPRNLDIVYNKAGKAKNPVLAAILRGTGRFGAVGRRVLPASLFGWLQRARDRAATANREGVRERLSPGLRRRLFADYEDEVARLERLLGRRLDVWRDGAPAPGSN